MATDIEPQTFKTLDGRHWLARVRNGEMEVSPNMGRRQPSWQPADVLSEELQDGARLVLGLPRP